MGTKDVAKLMAVEVMGIDYREGNTSSLLRLWKRIKKCLPGC